MPGRPTLISKVVPAGEILRALEAFPAFLLERGVEECMVKYGWERGRVEERLERPALIPLRDFVAGESDLYVELEKPAAEFVFCHESDIHLKTEDRDLMAAFRQFLEGLGIPVIHVST